MATMPLLHRIRRGDWVDHVITVAQISVGLVAVLGIAGWLSLNPFLLLSFIFAQPLIALGIALFIFGAFFFERAFMFEAFDPGEIIYTQGSPARSIWLIKSGTVEAVVRRSDGKQASVATFGPGQYLGYAALAPHIPHMFTAKAQTSVEIIRIRPSDFLTIFAELPEMKAQIPVLRQEIKDAIVKFAPELRDLPDEYDLRSR